MPNSKKEEIKKHGDTMEPLIDRTGTSTQRPRHDDAARRSDEVEQNPEGEVGSERD